MPLKRITYPSPGFSEYWQDGGGKKMLKKVDVFPTKKDVENCSKLYMEYDALSDENYTRSF